jgi:2-C-methyl-D-erythritol 4-phosphate cytidylyltransferase
LTAVAGAACISGVVLVAPVELVASARDLAEDAIHEKMPIQVVEGGAERQDSVYNALRLLPSDCEWVLIHDGVRPFVSAALIDATMERARETGAAIAALPATDTVKRVESGVVVETLPRSEIYLVQTPQVFRMELLLSAYEEARRNGWSVTDDASLVERLGVTVSVVNGEPTNIKVTTPADLLWAEWFLGRGDGGPCG